MHKYNKTIAAELILGKELSYLLSSLFRYVVAEAGHKELLKDVRYRLS